MSISLSASWCVQWLTRRGQVFSGVVHLQFPAEVQRPPWQAAQSGSSAQKSPPGGRNGRAKCVYKVFAATREQQLSDSFQFYRKSDDFHTHAVKQKATFLPPWPRGSNFLEDEERTFF